MVAPAALVFGALFSYPLLIHPTVAGTFMDWDYVMQLAYASRESIIHYGQLPLWNPWKCGGMPLFANPQARLLSPFFVMTLIFGAPTALHLEVPLHLAIAWSGGYVLGRTLGMQRIAAVVCATVFAGSSWFTLRVAAGELVMMAYVYYPWLLAFAWQHRIWAAAVVLALISFEGGPYPSSYAVLLLFLILLSRAALDKSKRPLCDWTAICVLAVALAAIQILPAYHLLTDHPRPGVLDWDTIGGLLAGLLSRNQDLRQTTPVAWGFQEMAGYVGPLFGLMALTGIVFSPKRSLPWILVGAVMAALALGAWGPYWPWSLIHYLPVFSSERLPYRFIIPLVLTIAVLAGFGFDVLRGSRGYVIALAIIVLGGVDCLLMSPWQLGYALQNPAQLQTADPVFTQLRDGSAPSRQMLHFTEQNRGVVNCYEYTEWNSPVKGNADDGYKGNQYLLGPGLVRLLTWSPNKLSFAIDAPNASELMVNQNYDRFWTLTKGAGSVVSAAGLLAVLLPPGKQTLELSYRLW
jgi:hypothetical protein